MEKKNISSLLADSMVVPEIQREYVWGNNKRVVKSFIYDLCNALKDGCANIGFLYSYENGSERYIIDGQQRFTTIILLLHYLYAQSEGDELHEELERLLRLDDNLPALAYRVRATTLSFMNNLFHSRLIRVEEIKGQKWFKRCYENDVTIMSLLGTLRIFNEMPELRDLDFHRVLSSVSFWFFNVDQTSQGEELYITMNSRGEKLSDNEQLKPRLFAKLDDNREKERYGKLWDEWEEFFYANRHIGNKRRNIKAIDVAMNNIIRIVLELKTGSEHNTIKAGIDEESINLYDLERCMEAIEYLSRMNIAEFPKEIGRLYGDYDSDLNFYLLKALLVERLKGQTEPLAFERIYHTIKNQQRRGRIRSHIDYLRFLMGYSLSPMQFYDYALDEARLLYGDELEKVEICKRYGEETERAIWAVQERGFWNGNIATMINWARQKPNGEFSLSQFNTLHEKFANFFDEDQGNDCTTDIVRRALLCRGLENYPIYYDTMVSFGYTQEEWLKILANNEENLKEFFSGLGDDGSVEEYCGKIIESSDSSMDWAEFVEEPELMEYINTKRVVWNDEFGYMLVQNTRAKPLPVNAMLIYLAIRRWHDEIKSVAGKDDGWKVWYYLDKEHPCAVIDTPKFALDFLYRLKDENGEPCFYIQLFKRGENVDTEKELAFIATQFGFEFGAEIDRYHQTLPFDTNGVIELLRAIHEMQP